MGRGGQADGRTAGQSVELRRRYDRPTVRLSARPSCLRCGVEVPTRAWGCKNPCPNCNTIYPLGDCSD